MQGACRGRDRQVPFTLSSAMPTAHPLDRPVWSALTGRQASFTVVDGRARRFTPDVGVFAAVEDASPASLQALAALIRAYGPVVLMEAAAPPPIPGVAVAGQAPCVQMIMEEPLDAPATDLPIQALSETDAPQMLELALLTRPGPFAVRTNQLGAFIGIKAEGCLVAMAGERLQPKGCTEVSGVCTHPDYRGRGYAAALMRQVAAGVRARGETPFLHAYSSNTGAIALYRSLGFVLRRELVATSLAAEEDPS